MFTNLAQRNVDHYDNHPIAHGLIMIAYGAVAAVVLNKMLKKIADADI